MTARRPTVLTGEERTIRYLPLAYLAAAFLLALVALPSVLREPTPQQNASAVQTPVPEPAALDRGAIVPPAPAVTETLDPVVAGLDTPSQPAADAPSAPGDLACSHGTGEPRRQTEDPQSPPCALAFRGANGGATSVGVTADTVRVAVPHFTAEMPTFEAYFNRAFQFYGRQIRLIDSGRYGGRDEDQGSGARAAAAKTVFAALDDDNSDGGSYLYNQELARAGIVSVHSRPQYNAATLKTFEPYLWQYGMDFDAMAGNLGQWLCARLGTGAAIHAGPALAGRPRIYGLVLGTEAAANTRLTLAPLQDALGRCGIDAPVRLELYSPTADQFTAAAVRLAAQGVTTLVCLCHVIGHSGPLAEAMSSLAYEPEWVVSSYLFNDINEFMNGSFPADQAAHAFGLTFEPARRRVAEEPWIRALRTVRPDYVPPSSPFDRFHLRNYYRDLLLLASGIQQAGPVLTPRTFADGLHATAFPNPASSAGRVGFAGPSFSMTTDAAEMWFSTSDLDPDTGTAGVWCYVEGAARSAPGSWRHGDIGLFAGTCDPVGRT